MKSWDGKQFAIQFALVAPAGVFKDRCTDFQGFQSLADGLVAAITIIIAPVAAVFLAVGGLIASVYHACKGEYKQSANSLGWALGYAVMAPLSPVIALGSFMIRGIRSLYDLSSAYFHKKTEKPAIAASVEALEVQPEVVLSSDKNLLSPARSIEPKKSISSLYHERRRGLTLFTFSENEMQQHAPGNPEIRFKKF